ncbi:MAG TPA: hypothetical protein DCR87_03595, partial [Acidobacteria bacterium]|nr:hypothetical protein [Acidobacteriota bacterium]
LISRGLEVFRSGGSSVTAGWPIVASKKPVLAIKTRRKQIITAEADCLAINKMIPEISPG